MKIFVVKLEIVKCDWYIVDVEGKIFGCLVSEIVFCLCGKYKVEYIFYVDIGDYIIVLMEYDELLCFVLCVVGYVICDVCCVECKKVGLCKVCCKL